jgi:hypothetical protein
MRPRLFTVLLTASLLANAAFVATSLLPRNPSAASAPSGNHSSPQRNSSGPDSAAASAESVSPEAAATLGRILNSRDPARLRDLLQAAGVERELLRQLVAGAVWKSYETRFKTIHPENDPAVWWKEGVTQLSPTEQRTRNQRSRELQREVQAKIDSLLGTSGEIPDLADNPWLQRRYGALAPDKAAGLQRIEKDYQELIGDIRQSSGDFELPADREAIRLLKEERERDIAALLTPEERAAHALRSSPTADRLRWRMTQLDATEAEYLKIYPLQQAFDQQFEREDDEHYRGSFDEPDRGEDFWDRRRAAQEELNRQIRSVVGEERYLATQKQHDQDYTVAATATARLGLAADTPDRLYALRTPAVADSQKIAADPSLTADQKKAALKQIAATTRAQVEQTLGAEAASVYFKRGAMHWLNDLDRGAPLKLTDEGRVDSGPRIK